MKLTCVVILFCTVFSWSKISGTESDGRLHPMIVDPKISPTAPLTLQDKRKDDTAKRRSVTDDGSPIISEDIWPISKADEHPNFRDEFRKILVPDKRNVDPGYLSKNTDGSALSSTVDVCNREKLDLQRGFEMQVSKFKLQLVGLESLIRISIDDLILHLESGTLEDSWVGQLVEYGKHLTFLHPEHNEREEQPGNVDSTSKIHTGQKESTT